MLRCFHRFAAAVSLLPALLLAACGGGNDSPPPPPSPPNVVAPPGPTPTPPPPAAGCSLRARQDWAGAIINEWYLLPDTLPVSLDPARFSTVTDYIDALTATARAQGKDRFFTFLGSIAADEAFISSGATAAFGIRLQTDTNARRMFVIDSYEGAPALAAGIDRGAEILAIGTSQSNLESVSNLIARGGSALSDALGPANAGVTRTLQINSSDGNGTRTVTIAKANFDIPPVSPRFGARVITADGERIGYINLRTFIRTAEAPLRAAFADFRAQGITRFIVDFRYNGGGLLNQAYVFNDLLGQNRLPSDVANIVTFRPSKSANNETRLFQPQPESVAPARIAFITTGSSASASELVINSFIPYLRENAIMIGANSFGKPVGQLVFNRSECDDRLLVMGITSENADRQGDYFRGLASTVKASCAAGDTLAQTMGDPAEASTRIALDALAGRACTPISVDSRPLSTAIRERRDPLLPDNPTAAQRELPGTF